MTSRFELHSTEDTLRVLARLAEADRRWILERLPPAAKSRLSSAARNGSGNTVANVCSTEASREVSDAECAPSIIDRLESAPPTRILEILLGEPDWVVFAVLNAHDWHWKKEVLQRLPVSLRLDVLRLKRCGVTLARPATEFLLQTIAEVVGNSAAAAPRSRSFESLLRRFGRRAER